MNQKSVAALFVGGIVVLGGGSALAASFPSMWAGSPMKASSHTVMASHTAMAAHPSTTLTGGNTGVSNSSPGADNASSGTSATALSSAGGALTSPPSTPTTAPITAPPPVATPLIATSTTVAPQTAAPGTAPPAPSSGTITYTVKPGDNLSSIASWFKVHGYGPLYAANQAVIGANPNLIFAGERITISNGVMTLQPPT